jgi:hypothetical protein
MVSHQLEPEDVIGPGMYLFKFTVSLSFLYYLLVIDGEVESNPSAPSITYHDVEDAQPALEATRKVTPEKKRKEIPATTATETTVVTKKIKSEGSGSRGRIRQADFDELTRSILEETISIYRAQIGSVEPFPERTEDRNTVKQAWVEVCTSRNLRVELEEDIYKLVSAF